MITTLIAGLIGLILVARHKQQAAPVPVRVRADDPQRQRRR